MKNLDRNRKVPTIDSATDQELSEVELNRLNWLDSGEAAFYLRKSKNAIWLMVSRGLIRPRRLRRRIYFRKLDLDRLLESSH
jgi:hypothetical protein